MRRLILVLGCHRSGTSAVAAALPALGVELGPRAMWSGPDNVRGFYEDQDVLAFNEAVLRELGSSWDDPNPINLEAWLAHPGNDAIARAAALLAPRLSAFPMFGLKDPRLCRMLQLWGVAAFVANADISVIHVTRHPMAVARSLERRGSIPIDRGLRLWFEHSRAAQADSDPIWPSVTVAYDNILTMPRNELTRIGAALDLTMDQALARVYAREFLDLSLRHEITDDDDAALPTEVALEWELAKRRVTT